SPALSVDDPAQLALAEHGRGYDEVDELFGQLREDLGVAGAVGLQLRVPSPEVGLDLLGVEGEHVLPDPGGLRLPQARGRHQAGDEGPIGGHDVHSGSGAAEMQLLARIRADEARTSEFGRFWIEDGRRWYFR